MPSSQTSSPFHRLIVSEWGTATSVLLLALEVTWVSPACGSLLQASSCDAELTPPFILSCLTQRASPDNLQGSHNPKVHLQYMRKDILTLTYGKNNHNSLISECDRLSKQVQ